MPNDGDILTYDLATGKWKNLPPAAGGLWEQDPADIASLIDAGVVDMQSEKIINLLDPDDNQDAVTKKYVDVEVAAAEGLWEQDSADTASLTVPGVVDMQAEKIIDLLDPAAAQDAATKQYVDDNVAGTVPSAFHVHKNLTQDIPTGTYTKVTWEIEDSDSNDDFADSKYVVPSDGYYTFSAVLSGYLLDTKFGWVMLYKNGALWKTGSMQLLGEDGSPNLVVSVAVVHLSKDDEIEVYAYHNQAADWVLDSADTHSYFCGAKVQGGIKGDTGAAGEGNVNAGANITDEAIVRGDGGVKGVQDSVPTIDDVGGLHMREQMIYFDIAGDTSLVKTANGLALALAAGKYFDMGTRLIKSVSDPVHAQDVDTLAARAAAIAALKLDDLATPDDNVDLNSTVTEHGLLKKLDNVATNFMNGQGNWAAPAGGGGAMTQAFIFLYRTDAFDMAAANTWYDVPMNIASPCKKNVTHDHTSNPEQITLTEGGTYLIHSHVYSEPPVSARTGYYMRVLDDDEEIAGSESLHYMYNYVTEFQLNTTLAYIATDSVIKLQVKCSTASKDLNRAWISILKISDDTS